jgi:hypothetical protein
VRGIARGPARAAVIQNAGHEGCRHRQDPGQTGYDIGPETSAEPQLTRRSARNPGPNRKFRVTRLFVIELDRLPAVAVVRGVRCSPSPDALPGPGLLLAAHRDQGPVTSGSPAQERVERGRYPVQRERLC